MYTSINKIGNVRVTLLLRHLRVTIVAVEKQRVLHISVCVRERETERARACVCVCERETESTHVCV